MAAAPAGAATGDDRIVLKHDPGLSAADQRDLRDDAGVRLVSTLPMPDVQVVDPIGNPRVALLALQADPGVRWAEVDGIAQGAANPAVAQQWWLSNTGQDVLGVRGTPGADISGLRAQQASAGAGVTVGVVDTGAQLDHPDLRLTGNPGERGGGRETNGIDDDHNGKVDDWQGWDFVGADNAPTDGNGHGTHVSGIVAAGDDGVGGLGVAPQAQVLPLRALDDQARGFNSGIAAAFSYAGDLGVRVVNASLDSGAVSLAQLDAITSHPNTLYVVAAGNDGRDLGLLGAITYPCGIPLSNVICVGASDQFDERAPSSNYGTLAVDLFAPGESILSDWLGGTVGYSQGTSMASPQVAGVAALLLARSPSLSTAGLRQAILGSVDVRSGLSGSVTGGRLDAAAALESIGVSVPALPAPDPATPDPALVVPTPPAKVPAAPAKIPVKTAPSTTHSSTSTRGRVAVKAASGLHVTRAVRSTRHRTVTVRGTISKHVSGKLTVRLRLRLAGGGWKTVTGKARVTKGRFTVKLKLSRTAVRARSGTVTVTYAGSASLKAASASATMR